MCYVQDYVRCMGKTRKYLSYILSSLTLLEEFYRTYVREMNDLIAYRQHMIDIEGKRKYFRSSEEGEYVV